MIGKEKQVDFIHLLMDLFLCVHYEPSVITFYDLLSHVMHPGLYLSLSRSSTESVINKGSGLVTGHASLRLIKR